MLGLSRSPLTVTFPAPPEPLVDEWYGLLMAAGFLQEDIELVQSTLMRLESKLYAQLYAHRFDSKRARGVGISLMMLCKDKPLALERSQRLLACRLLEGMSLSERMSLQPRLSQLLSEVAVGFLEAQAKEARTVSRAVVSSIGHELYGFFNLITGFSNILLLEYSGPLTELQQKDIGAILDASEQLHQRLKHLMEIAKLETRATKIKRQMVDVAEFVAEIHETVSPLMARNENRFDLQMSNAPTTVITDEKRLRQVLLALLDNAAKFTVQGHVTLRVQSDKGGYSFSVMDDGMGIAPSRLATLLNERQGVETNEHRSGGVLVSRRLCQLMGGTLSATSRVGEGSTFVVHLPL